MMSVIKLTLNLHIFDWSVAWYKSKCEKKLQPNLGLGCKQMILAFKKSNVDPIFNF